jgi:hypothetical protein
MTFDFDRRSRSVWMDVAVDCSPGLNGAITALRMSFNQGTLRRAGD